MAASYPGAVKTFTTKAAGGAILAAHINDLQDEVVAVETQLGAGAGRWTSWTPTVTWSGGTTDPTSSTLAYAKYVVIGKMVTINVVCTVVRGSGDRTYAQFTLPINSAVNGICGSGVEDLTTALRTPCNVSNYAYNSVVVYLPSAMARDGSMRFTFTYEIA